MDVNPQGNFAIYIYLKNIHFVLQILFVISA